MALDKETMERETDPHNTSQHQTFTACRTMHLSRSDGIHCIWFCCSIERRPSYRISRTFKGGIPAPVLNPETELCSPQFHVKYGDFFEYVWTKDYPGKSLSKWKNLAGLEKPRDQLLRR
eukprot:15335521-Ditylum_brightwellii.AAC.1